MENIGHIEIKIQGKKGNLELSPDTYDIRELKEILETVEKLLFPEGKIDRPTTYGKLRDAGRICSTSLQDLHAVHQ